MRAAVEHLGEGEIGERLRALGAGRLGGDQAQRPLVVGVRGLAGGAGRPREPRAARVQHARAHGVRDRIGQLDGLVEQHLRARAVARPQGDLGRPLEHVEAARRLLGVRHGVPQLQHAPVLRGGLGERVHALGGRARPHARRQRAAVLARRVPVARDGGQGARARVAAERRPLGEHAGAGGVQAPALAGQQRRVGRLARELVAEAEPAVARVRDQHLVRHRLAQRRGEVRELDQLGEQLVVHARARDRGGAHRLLAGRPERGDPPVEHVADRRRQRLRVAVAGGGEQLLGQERVAARAAGDLGGGGGIGRGAEDRRQQVADLDRRERRELQPPRARGAADLREPGAQSGPPRHLVAAVGGDEQDPLVPERPGQEAGEVERRAVGPVDVLEHEHERRGGRRLGEQVVDLTEQPRAGRVVGPAAVGRAARRPASAAPARRRRRRAGGPRRARAARAPGRAGPRSRPGRAPSRPSARRRRRSPPAPRARARGPRARRPGGSCRRPPRRRRAPSTARRRRLRRALLRALPARRRGPRTTGSRGGAYGRDHPRAGRRGQYVMPAPPCVRHPPDARAAAGT